MIYKKNKEERKMKNLLTILALISTLVLTSCGSGGGGGGNPTPSKGNVTLTNLALEADVPNQCLTNKIYPRNKILKVESETNSDDCLSIGGTWEPKTSDDTCVIGEVTYSCGTGSCASTTPVTGDVAKCEAEGGSFISSDDVYYCKTTGVTLPTCEELGGQELTLSKISGDVIDNHLKSGNNDVYLELFNDVEVNPTQFPVAIQVDLSISGSNWTATVMGDTGDSFSSTLLGNDLVTTVSTKLPFSSNLRIDKMYLLYYKVKSH